MVVVQGYHHPKPNTATHQLKQKFLRTNDVFSANLVIPFDLLAHQKISHYHKINDDLPFDNVFSRVVLEFSVQICNVWRSHTGRNRNRNCDVN